MIRIGTTGKEKRQTENLETRYRDKKGKQKNKTDKNNAGGMDVKAAKKTRLQGQPPSGGTV